MIPGDYVRVYPHGHPDQSAVGKIALLSSSATAILVMFGDKPPFTTGPILLTDIGIPFFAHRYELEGKAWGPWVEQFNGGMYEIEECPAPGRTEDDQ